MKPNPKVEESMMTTMRTLGPEPLILKNISPIMNFTKWCRYPEPLPFDSQDEAGCQDTVARFKELFIRKRLDVMSDFTKGVFNGFDEDDVPKDPTEEQMQAFAGAKQITPAEAWRTLRGEQTILKFAIQAIAFGYTPAKRNLVKLIDQRQELNQARNPNRTQCQESRMVRKCMNAIYNVMSYSYLRDDLRSNDMHKCIDPLDLTSCIQGLTTSGTE